MVKDLNKLKISYTKQLQVKLIEKFSKLTVLFFYTLGLICFQSGGLVGSCCHTDTKEERSSEDPSCGSGAGQQHRQHGPPEHQLLRHRRHHLVPEPHCVFHTTPPRLNIWKNKSRTSWWWPSMQREAQTCKKKRISFFQCKHFTVRHTQSRLQFSAETIRVFHCRLKQRPEIQNLMCRVK